MQSAEVFLRKCGARAPNRPGAFVGPGSPVAVDVARFRTESWLCSPCLFTGEAGDIAVSTAYASVLCSCAVPDGETG